MRAGANSGVGWPAAFGVIASALLAGACTLVSGVDDLVKVDRVTGAPLADAGDGDPAVRR